MSNYIKGQQLTYKKKQPIFSHQGKEKVWQHDMSAKKKNGKKREFFKDFTLNLLSHENLEIDFTRNFSSNLAHFTSVTYNRVGYYDYNINILHCHN